MKSLKYILSCVLLSMAGAATQPVMAQVNLSDGAYPVIVAPHKQTVSYRERTLCYEITANVNFTATSANDWISVRKSDDGTVYVHLTTNPGDARTGTVVFEDTDGNGLTETLVITQTRNESAESLPTDTKVSVSSGTANTYESGTGIALTYDGNTSTFYHSAWSSAQFVVSAQNPAILTYTFANDPHIDYALYTTRQDGTSNGNFGEVEVYATYGGESGFRLVTTVDLNEATGQHRITFGDAGLDDVKSIRFNVLSGYGDFASCAEMEFFETNPERAQLLSLFKDEACTELRDGITQADIDDIDNELIGTLAQGLYDGTYSKDYRVADYTAKLSYVVQSDMWNAPGKYYDQRQGVTGINITKGQHAIAVSGLPDNVSLPLLVTAWFEGKYGENFDGGNPVTSSYSLSNGLNTITYDFDYDGLAYICYYADANPELMPAVTVHFINGDVNGYLSPDKTNEEMHELTANAKNICMDVVGSKVHSVWTANGLHSYCKAQDGSSLGYRQYMNVLDSLIDWEHELLGFKKYDLIPDNRTFAYVNYTYYMFQGSLGVSFIHSQEYRVLNCRTLILNDNDAIWGLSHEWGHQHQMHPYFCWAGMSEVTNNMNAYYNIMKMGYHTSDKIESWPVARRHFIDANYQDITPSYLGSSAAGSRNSNMRHNAYVNRSTFSSYPNLMAMCAEMKDSVITNYSANPDRALTINEVSVGETLCPFVMLYNYFTINGLDDFAPDWYEALRQTDNENGSQIEKTGEVDKYELIASAQNGNKNGKYEVLKAKYPESCWITEQYVDENSSQWDNSAPYVMNYIRKVSRLTGYNLFPYFERWGFLRQVALLIGDYGNKWFILTPEMYDEFKADMDALVESGELQEMPSGMIETISNTKDLFDTGYKNFGTTPSIPN